MEKTLIISSQLINLNKVRFFLDKVYAEYNLNRNSFNRIFLGISEAVNNAILHGNKLNPEKEVFIGLKLLGQQLHIDVVDEGEGFCEAIISDPTYIENIKLEHGRGIYIIRQIADKLVFKENGRKVCILFTIPE